MQTGRLSPSQIHIHGSHLQGKGCLPGPLRPWHQRRAIRRLRNDGSTEAVRILAGTLAWGPPNDGATHALLLQALEAMGEPAQLQAIAEEATARGSRHAPTPLLNLLKSADRFPLLPPDHRVAVAMACGEPELLIEAGAEVVPPLLQAWERQGPKGHAETALLALRSSAAVDGLCRHWIDQGAREDRLRQLLLQAGHAPSDPAERSLHLWLIGPVDPSGVEDRNGSLLVRALAAASPPLRQRVVAAVLAQGHAEWLLQAMQRRKPLPSFDANDWADVVGLLGQTDDGDVLWRWALKAPPELTRPLLQAIPANALLPPEPLGRLHRPHLLQVVGEEATRDWPERVSPPLIAILKSAGFVPLAPPEQRVAVALACGWPARLAEDGPAILPPLLKAWRAEASKGLAAAALAQLRSPATTDALCRHWVAEGEGDDGLAALLREAGHAPSDPAERALFWMLSGQLEPYDQLDGDGSLLAQAQAAASAPVRQRLAAASAAAGRTAWLQVVQQSQPLEAFSADDWAAAVPVVARTGDAETLWRWALQCPPLHSRTLLRALPAGAAPPPQLGEAGRVLQALAQELPAPGDLSGLRLDHCTRVLEGHGGEVEEVAWSPAGRSLASASADGTIRLWNSTSGACNHILEGHGRTHHSGKRNAMAWSPDGRSLASAGHDGRIIVWDTASGERSQIHQGLSESQDPHFVFFHKLNQIAWSADGRWIAANVADRAILVWDPISGVCIQSPERNGSWVAAMEWSPRGGVLAYVTESGIRMWDPQTSTLTPILDDQRYWLPSVCWSPDGSRLASCSLDDTIRLWEAPSGACTRRLLSEGGHAHWMEAPRLAAWAPDGRCLASASEDGTIRLWDAASGACTHTLKDLRGYNRSLAWSPDGRYLASIGGNETIRLWNPLSGTCAHTLEGHRGYVRGMDWSPDGTCLASASVDGTVRLWRHPLEFEDALTTPLLRFDKQLWHAVSAFKTYTLPTAEWQWVLPWLRFIASLGGVIRRFDVGLEETTTPHQKSPYAVFLDG